MRRKKKVLLLNPPGKKRYVRDLYCSKISAGFYYWQPADLVVLSALLKKDFEIEVLDAIVEEFSYDQALNFVKRGRYDFVISLIGSASLEEDLKFLKEVKEKTDSYILISGDLTTDPKNRVLETWSFVDAIISDLSTEEIVDFLARPNREKRFKHISYRFDKKIIRGKTSHQGGEFSIPIPPHELFNLDKYELPFFNNKGVATLVSALGCPFNCSFCISGTFPLKFRSVGNVIRELEHLASLNIMGISFRDPLFEAHLSRAKKLCRRIIEKKMKFNWCCNSRVDTILQDKELLPLMEKAGCFMVNFGVESGSDKILKSINKKIKIDQIKRAFSECRKNKIDTCGYFIIGLPEDNEETIRETINFAKKLNPSYAVFSIPSPDYRTEIRKYFISKGLVNKNKIEGFDRGGGSGESLGTKFLSPEEVIKFQRQAFKEFYLRPKYILWRLGELRSFYKVRIIFRELKLMMKNYFFQNFLLKKHKRKIFIFLFGFLFLGYLFLIWNNFKVSLSTISSSFGYLDYQNNWRGLDDFIKFKVPFKDYFYEYGWFFLFLQAQAYLFFGRSFLAVLISRYLYLPLVGLFLSYIVALNILKKKHLILIFLVFLLLFGTNYDYTSPRHLIAELGLSFFILFFLQKQDKYLLISGIISGLAVLTALEYGVALNIAIFFVFLLSLLSRVKLRKNFFNRFILGQSIVLSPYLLWLYLKGALGNYWEFTYGFIKNFYHASPCSGSFPRLSEIQALVPVSKLLVFNVPIEFLQRFNFYIVFSFYAVTALASFAFFIKNKKFSRNNLVKLSLVIYGLLIFFRTLNDPCVGYFVYGLVPFFLLVTFLIEEIIVWSRRKGGFAFKAIGVFGIAIIFFWFILTENTGYIVKIFGKKETQVKKDTYEKEFYSPAGWFINKELAKRYKEVTNYIVENTGKDDFLYVYPWGPYNNLTGRPPPNSITSLHQFLVGEQFITRTKVELETKKPKLVVINIYNNLGVAHFGKARGDVPRYFSLGYEDGPVFNGEGSIIEEYILENYEPVLKNDLAIVMKQRTKSITIDKKKKEVYTWRLGEEEKIELQSMEKRESDNNYKITGEKASWTLIFEDPIEASDIAVEFKLDGSFLTKHLSRYFVNLYALDEGGEKLGGARVLARKNWQTDKINFSQPRKIKALKIEIGENTGLIWWLNLYRLEIRGINFYNYLP